MKTYTHVVHDLQPVYDDLSEILILGSLPSVKSRGQFFYHHPQNRFWKVIAAVTGEATPLSIEEKQQVLLRNHIAVWDVIAECDIIGSSDSSIKNVHVNDVMKILTMAPIRTICVNGKTAKKLYDKYLLPVTKREAICLPSTSPANAAWSIEALIETWHIVNVKSLTEHTKNQNVK